ncbi:MAG: hypothetical protein GX142_06555 [Chloroflexi bacterium]|jgi:hypothetical protein|nr:hypothetical protein [Chloroflexota bacterium]
MTEEISYIPEPTETFQSPPEKKSKKTLWIIIAIVAVLILCCCVAAILAMTLGWFSFDAFDDLFSGLWPYLSLI